MALRDLDETDAAIIKGMLRRGDYLHHIASWFGCNSARVAEIKAGERWPDVWATPEVDLPPPGPYIVVATSDWRRLKHLVNGMRYREND